MTKGRRGMTREEARKSLEKVQDQIRDLKRLGWDIPSPLIAKYSEATRRYAEAVQREGK